MSWLLDTFSFSDGADGATDTGINHRKLFGRCPLVPGDNASGVRNSIERSGRFQKLGGAPNHEF